MVAISIPESDKLGGKVTANGTPRTQTLLQPTDFYGTIMLLPPSPEPTEAQTAKAISIAAVRRAVRNEKRAEWAKSNQDAGDLKGIICNWRSTQGTPQIFQKGAK